ncbi:unnamed protein product [Gordionus sp. m RMFG-2023]
MFRLPGIESEVRPPPPLSEQEIGAVCIGALSGLDYLHNLGRIHRDVKAGNILFTEDGRVKLGDFGSASLVSMANSFVGTPYWMAPEVILAMDEGHYDSKSDIWSIGITCIELAERKPPYFNMNAMSALYHIAQSKSPPTLTKSNVAGKENLYDWSLDFRNFVESCLNKNPEHRLTAQQLLQHSFLSRLQDPRVILLDLIARTTEAVRKLDNLSYRKMKKMLLTSDENNLSPENSAVIETPTLLLTSALPLEEVGDENSSSTLRSSGGSVFSGSSYYPPCEARLHLPGSLSTFLVTSTSSTRLTTPDSSNIDLSNLNGIQGDYRSPPSVTRFAGYKRFRKRHQRSVNALESKTIAEIKEMELKWAKESKILETENAKERDRLGMEHRISLENRVKSNLANEKKLIKRLEIQLEKGFKEFSVLQKKNLKNFKEKFRKELDSIRLQSFQHQQISEMDALSLAHQRLVAFELAKFRRKRLVQYHSLERDLLREELNQKQAHMERLHESRLKKRDTFYRAETRHLVRLQSLKREQYREQHAFETANQTAYNIQAERELKKNQAGQRKSLPKELKEKENKIRKQFNDVVRIQEKQYKILKAQIIKNVSSKIQFTNQNNSENNLSLTSLPLDLGDKNNSNNPKDLVKHLKEEKGRKLVLINRDYEKTIADMLQKQTLIMDQTQKLEMRELNERLNREMTTLLHYQHGTRDKMETLYAADKDRLEAKYSEKLIILEQKVIKMNQGRQVGQLTEYLT